MTYLLFIATFKQNNLLNKSNQKKGGVPDSFFVLILNFLNLKLLIMKRIFCAFSFVVMVFVFTLLVNSNGALIQSDNSPTSLNIAPDVGMPVAFSNNFMMNSQEPLTLTTKELGGTAVQIVAGVANKVNLIDANNNAMLVLSEQKDGPKDGKPIPIPAKLGILESGLNATPLSVKSGLQILRC